LAAKNNKNKLLSEMSFKRNLLL